MCRRTSFLFFPFISKRVLYLLVTTGKKPDFLQKLIANALFLSVPESLLEGRGKRTIVSLLKKAHRLHFSRICTLSKREGGASEMSFLSLEEDGGWQRLSPTIIAQYAVACEEKKAWRQAQSRSLKLAGTKRAALQRLLLPLNADSGPVSSITAGASTLSFKLGKTELLKLGVKYEK